MSATHPPSVAGAATPPNEKTGISYAHATSNAHATKAPHNSEKLPNVSVPHPPKPPASALPGPITDDDAASIRSECKKRRPEAKEKEERERRKAEEQAAKMRRKEEEEARQREREERRRKLWEKKHAEDAQKHQDTDDRSAAPNSPRSVRTVASATSVDDGEEPPELKPAPPKPVAEDELDIQSKPIFSVFDVKDAAELMVPDLQPIVDDAHTVIGKAKDEVGKLIPDVAPVPNKALLVSYPRAVKDVTWAPLNIPIERRLQTAAVLWHSLAISIFFSMFWFTLAVPLTWPILLPYLLYIIFIAKSHEDGSVPYNRKNFLRRFPLWKGFAEYFPIRLHRMAVLDPTKNYIFAYHPHGIISHGAFGNFATEATGFSSLFPGITNTLLTLDSNFRIPFYREYLLSIGLASVSRRSCESLLRGEGAPRNRRRGALTRIGTTEKPTSDSGGRAITIVIGGARESLEAFPGVMRLVCRRRRGFLKIAIRENAGVVPVLSFGENDLYDQAVPGEKTLLHKLQNTVKKTMGVALPMFHARGIFNYDVGLMPYRREVNTVVGRPLFPKQQSWEPSEEMVDEFQERYIQELTRMWEENKDVFAATRLPGMDGELQIIE